MQHITRNGKVARCRDATHRKFVVLCQSQYASRCGYSLQPVIVTLLYGICAVSQSGECLNHCVIERVTSY